MNRQTILAVGAVVLIFILFVQASQQPNEQNSLQTLSDYLLYASLNNADTEVS